MAASTKVDLELYQEIYAAFQRISSNVTKVTNGDATIQISLQPVTTHAVLRGRSLGGNVLNLSAEPQQCKNLKKCPEHGSPTLSNTHILTSQGLHQRYNGRTKPMIVRRMKQSSRLGKGSLIWPGREI